MMTQFSSDKDIVVFDLDDTLYKEIDYLKSAYNEIANSVGLDVADEMFCWYLAGKNAFQSLIDKYHVSLTLPELLDIYRFHEPKIKLLPDAEEFLSALRESNVHIGIISDGRSRTQRNKLRALGIDWIDDVVISEEFGSEKPSEGNYRHFMDKYPNMRYYYFADNIKKDFITPNRLGWRTVCLKDDGRNIHKQDFSLSQEFLPTKVISGYGDCLWF